MGLKQWGQQALWEVCCLQVCFQWGLQTHQPFLVGSCPLLLDVKLLQLGLFQLKLLQLELLQLELLELEELELIFP